MTSIADQLRAIADQLDGRVTEEPALPGQIAVRPTGPLGNGKVRYYPARESLSNPDCNLLGYVSQIAELGYTDKNAMGRFFMAGDFINALAAQGRYAEAVDRMDHPQDWATQEELDRQAREQERDRASNARFSPR